MVGEKEIRRWSFSKPYRDEVKYYPCHMLDNLEDTVWSGLQSKTTELLEVITTVRKMMDELQNLQQTNSLQQLNPVLTERSKNLTWERPSREAIQINCDATWCSSTRRGGIGVIARNHNDEVVGEYHSLEVADNVEYLETQVLYEYVKLAIEKRWENVLTESNADSVINHIKGSSNVS